MTTDTNKNAIARLSDITSVTVTRIDDHLVVNDGASQWFCEASDITSELMNEYDANPEESLAWSDLCQQVQGMHDGEVPAGILAKACIELDSDSISYGF